MLILCTCIEAVQVATDGFVVSKMRKGQKPRFSREEYFFNLEKEVYSHCVGVFHTAYKTHKSPRQRGFNPIRDGLEVDNRRGITQQAVDLVNEIKKILKDYGRPL